MQPAARRAATFRPTPVIPLADQIRRQLVDAVSRGELRPGDRLPGEATLAPQFGVSVAQVRAGLNALVALGLIEVTRGRHGGLRIAEPKPQLVQQALHDGLAVLADLSDVSLADLAEARREAETACARAAARRRTTEDLDRLAEALARSTDPTLGVDEWLDLDIMFHRGVADASHNRVLALPLTAVHAVSQPRLNRLIADQLDRPQIHTQHDAIYQAIRAGDTDKAATAVRAHVTFLEACYARLR